VESAKDKKRIGDGWLIRNAKKRWSFQKGWVSDKKTQADLISYLSSILPSTYAFSPANHAPSGNPQVMILRVR